ncbi:hypothetical protein [Salinisphaera sp. LB1]|uniref:hypothetical protein n=1 Tax=Salinisphaera sp. LB1 TaxID=2183911 RepID=UPI0011AB5CA6|nr:hypothetical protein [Salinisphaera sp. LB1]
MTDFQHRPKAAFQSATNQPNQANAFFFDSLPQPADPPSKRRPGKLARFAFNPGAVAPSKRLAALREGAF